jgi:glycosyltransferase involved in cell wall biosynthesis
LLLSHVWPEPRSSAAGWRELEWVGAFLERGWSVAFGAATSDNPERAALEARGVLTHAIRPNDPAFDEWVRSYAPDVVLFSRFAIEEQFSWRVRAAAPEAVRVLDTVDLHSLRLARERALREGATLAELVAPEFDPLAHAPDETVRELAAILRSDLSLVLSPAEHRLLTERFQVPAELLCESALTRTSAPRKAAAERRHFCSIGNFRHPPNADGVRWLHAEIWPALRKLVPRAELHVYGAYLPRELQALDDAATGFRFLGQAPDAVETLGRYRVNLAALRFGAGMKGKILDGWEAGTPTVTTPIGAEGMGHAFAVAGTAEGFARVAARVYGDEAEQERLRAAGAASLTRAPFEPAGGRHRLIERIR